MDEEAVRIPGGAIPGGSIQGDIPGKSEDVTFLIAVTLPRSRGRALGVVRLTEMYLWYVTAKGAQDKYISKKEKNQSRDCSQGSIVYS